MNILPTKGKTSKYRKRIKLFGVSKKRRIKNSWKEKVIKERKKNTWLSADQVTIVEREGKIIRTLGLTNNLTSIRPQSVNHVELVKNKDNPIYKSFISLDNPEVFELELKVKVLNKGLEEIEILDKKYSLIHFIEEKENRYLRWKSKDHYWVDPEDGFVWKSIQNIAPNIPPILIEVTKKPAG